MVRRHEYFTPIKLLFPDLTPNNIEMLYNNKFNKNIISMARKGNKFEKVIKKFESKLVRNLILNNLLPAIFFTKNLKRVFINTVTVHRLKQSDLNDLVWNSRLSNFKGQIIGSRFIGEKYKNLTLS